MQTPLHLPLRIITRILLACLPVNCEYGLTGVQEALPSVAPVVVTKMNSVHHLFLSL